MSFGESVLLPVILEKQGHVAKILLNRPEARNALTPEMLCRFADAVADCRADTTIRAVIISGSGDQAFCAGGDLGTTIPLFVGERKPQDDWERRLLSDPEVLGCSTLREPSFDKPVIAAVNGHCHAAGAEMLLGADIRFAVPAATFAWPEVRRGVIPFAGSLVRLPRQIGYCEAMRLMLTGQPIGANKAVDIGLINEIVPPQDLMLAAERMALLIAANSPIAVRHAKATAISSSGLELRLGYRLEDEARKLVFASEDAREGPRAFMEKRTPRFSSS
jgi:enoyl-CoA hydratase